MQQESTGAGSVSRLRLELGIIGKQSVQCELVRHLAPTTCKLLLSSLPVQGLVHKYGDLFAYFESGLVIGSEKQRTQFRRGDMGLLVANGSICIFLKDTTSQPINPIGRVVEDLQPIELTRPGDVMILKKSIV
jgi:uncharacterized protein